MEIDLSRFRKGAEQLRVMGQPGKSPQRLKVIEDAITAIQTNPETALSKEYMGVKNYAGFGDQRCDCEYGMRPTHGSMVFEVGRNRKNESAMDGDAIYALEVFRDTGTAEFPDNPFVFGDRDSAWRAKIRNIFEAVTFIDSALAVAQIMGKTVHDLDVTPSA